MAVWAGAARNRDRPESGTGLFEELLVAYRNTNSFEGVDDREFQIIKEHTPFLRESEKESRRETLSFDFVRRTFLHEFDRRREENLKNGYGLYTVMPPAIR